MLCLSKICLKVLFINGGGRSIKKKKQTLPAPLFTIKKQNRIIRITASLIKEKWTCLQLGTMNEKQSVLSKSHIFLLEQKFRINCEIAARKSLAFRLG